LSLSLRAFSISLSLVSPNFQPTVVTFWFILISSL
jgi:hypothetical protein